MTKCASCCDTTTQVKICNIGLGYVGLPTAIVFASQGLNVVGIDINQHAINKINEGQCHITEPHLEELLVDVVNKGKLKAQLQPEPADVFIICVPTPIDNKTKEPDMSYVISATQSIAPYLQKNNLVILESTSPLGSIDLIANILQEIRPDLKCSPDKYNNDDLDIMFAYCPERILPGNTVHELTYNSRIIGGINKKSCDTAQELYKTFCLGEIILTDVKTAEMSKLIENSYRDVNIAFANELSMFCEKNNINTHELISVANKHPRVNILNPSVGVGGHCLPVDPWFLVHSEPQLTKLIQLSRQVNDEKTNYTYQKIQKKILEINAQNIAICGISYKPDIDDCRNSPSIDIINLLTANNSNRQISIIDPYYSDLPRNINQDNNISLVNFASLKEYKNYFDLVIVLTPHSDFSSINLNNLVRKQEQETKVLAYAS